MNSRDLRKGVKQTLLDIEYRLSRARKRGHHGSYSNFGEQEILEKYIKLLKIDEKGGSAVDIGAGDGVRKSNTYGLVLRGWQILGVEYDSRNAARLAATYKFHPNAFACRFEVTSANIAGLLTSYSIDKNFGVLSLDIDGCDYWVLDQILTNFRPRLIVSEYNEKIPPPVKFAVNDAPEFSLRHHFFGYSISMLKDLLAKHDYVLLEVEYNNVFLAPAELASEYSVDVERGYREGYVDRPDRTEKFKANDNMEILLTLPPNECVEFLNNFYSDYAGEFQIGLE